MKEKFIRLLKGTDRENIDLLIEWLEKERDVKQVFGYEFEGGYIIKEVKIV